jgi:large subunit ribosomal protein L29
MKIKAIKDLTPDELRHQYEETQKEVFHLRVQQATGQLERPSRLRELRRDIARMLTVENERKKEAKA